MSFFNPQLAEVAQRDGRYAYEAYEFVFLGLAHTQKLLGKPPLPDDVPPAELAADERHHVKGRELLEGIRSLALQEFGLMARVVFQRWGIRSTLDFGQIVFNLVGAELLSKTDEDSLVDFQDGFDFDDDLAGSYRIEIDEAG